MVRRSVFAVLAVMAVVLGCVVVSTPAGAVVDTAVVVPSPNAGTTEDALSSVSCVSKSWCVAVGHTSTDTGNVTLVEMWNGTVWLVVPSPSPFLDSTLTSVECLSESSCTAVGDSTDTGPRNMLVEAWNGTEWMVVPSPGAGSFRSDVVKSVSCVSTTSCVAVGQTWTGSAFATLVMVWDGAAWSVVSSPNAGTSDDELNSVSCVSATECVAVGSADVGLNASSAYVTLVMVWDGVEWSIVLSPNAGTSDDTLRSVSCPSVSECVAVGYTYTGSVYETLVMVWDGIDWSIVSSPNAGTSDDTLNSVSCPSVSECVAVGHTDPSSDSETLVMVWDGIEWSIVSSPNAGTNDTLMSVSCPSVSECVAVGRTDTGSGDETLVVSLTGPVPPSTTTTTETPSSTSVSPDPVAPAFTG